MPLRDHPDRERGLGQVAASDQDCEHLFRIRLIQVNERGRSLAARRGVYAGRRIVVRRERLSCGAEWMAAEV